VIKCCQNTEFVNDRQFSAVTL